MAGSLQFTVEVAADKATQALEIVSRAFDQAGVKSARAMTALSRAAQRAAQEAVEAARRQAQSVEELEDRYAAIRQANGDENLAQRILALNRSYARELSIVDHNSKTRIDIENRYRAQMLAIEREIAEARERAAGGGIAPIVPTANRAGKAVESLGDKMRVFARGQRQEAAAARFFVNELAAIVPVSGNVRAGLVGIGSALVGGLGLATAVGLVTTAVSMLTAGLEENARALEEAKRKSREYLNTLASGTPQALERLRGLKTDRALALVDDDRVSTFDIKADEERRKLQAELDAKTNAAAAGPVDAFGKDRFKAQRLLDRDVIIARNALRAFEEKNAAERLNVIAQVAGKAEEERARKREQSQKEADARIAKNWWEEFNAQVAAEERRIAEKEAAEARLGGEMSDYYETVLGGRVGLVPKNATVVDVPSSEYSADIGAGAAQLGAEDDANQKAIDSSQQLTQQVAGMWIDALAQMVEATDLSAQSMIKLFAQLAGQMMQMAGFSMGGPIAGLFGALAVRAVPKAHTGWDIPRSLGEVPVIAQGGEKILSRSASTKLDALLANGGGAAVPTPVTIVAMDGPSLKDFIIRNGTDFNSAVRELARQGR